MWDGTKGGLSSNACDCMNFRERMVPKTAALHKLNSCRVIDVM